MMCKYGLSMEDEHNSSHTLTSVATQDVTDSEEDTIIIENSQTFS